MDQHGKPHNTILRRATGRHDGSPEAVDAGFVLDRLTTLAHELGNLLDGSMRCVSLARSALPDGEDGLETARHRLETAYGALERMAELVHGAMVGPRRASIITPAGGFTLVEAIKHAADVCEPIARDAGVELSLAVEPGLGEIPAGPIYPVLLNGLRNAIESVAMTRRPGHVLVSADRDARTRRVHVTISDTGVGPPTRVDHAFQFGYTTKPEGMGVGLAVCRDIVGQLRGSITLEPGSGDAQRPGAVLRICYPQPADEGGITVGSGPPGAREKPYEQSPDIDC